MPLNLMALGTFAVLGLANPGFWLLGAAAEVGYLSWLAGNPRFQNLVDAEQTVGSQRDWHERVSRVVSVLSRDSRKRYERLLEQSRRILGITEDFEEDALGSMRDMRGRSLNQLLWIFLRLLRSREVIAENIKGVDRRQLEREIRELDEQLAGNDESEGALVRSRGGRLDIQKKRLENLDRANESLKVIAAELLRIEQQVELIREEAAVSGKPEVLSSRLDAVTTAMDETTRWMDAHSDLFGALGEDDEAESVELPPRRLEEG